MTTAVKPADDVLDQFEDGEADRPDDPAEWAGAGGRGDQMTEVRGRK